MEFDLVKYRHDDDGLIEIVFIDNKSNTFLFFDGGDIKYVDELILQKYLDWTKIKLNGIITSIRQTNDFDFIFRLVGNLFLKIYFFPDDSYPNGVVQTLIIVNEKSLNYNNVFEDFSLANSEIQFQ